ncbi:alternate-type signal peptide domain-containing protein [Nocardioides humilatus]|uniref:Alternate-type signal peptide domain-containing protein n=1 Tax=Nocardioides humilatus TaxID=2607660 RepID=A0A5B1L4H3_9ACTN|nr:alternate-type signal peptide domain-containing protein [Nocardioides humilatus]KAA1415336.1 alternate-type signal peptide domain-containing protein [Nocardioides humilatus]
MKKSTKGALAAAAAAALLVGGAGTLAFWTDDESVPGGTIDAGHLDLTTDVTNTGCGDWELDSGEQAPVTWNDGDPLVPGDVLTMDCAFTIDAQGNHLRATVAASAPSLTGSLAAGLDIDAVGLTVGGSPATEFTEADDGSALGVSVTVTFTDPGTADNTYNDPDTDISAVLDDITVTATQVHS